MGLRGDLGVTGTDVIVEAKRMVVVNKGKEKTTIIKLTDSTGLKSAEEIQP